MIGVGSLMGVLSAGFARLIAVESLKWLAMKALLITFITLILPVILYNIFQMICLEMVTYCLDKINAEGFTALTVQLTGIAGWIAIQLDLALSISIILSAVALKFIVSMIWK